MSGPSNELDPEAPERGELVVRRERPRERAQLRAALALEEAGELQEAARMFEYVGEHAQAASLRLEHADTLRDESQRLAVLREGCARNPSDSEQGKALHRALGETLVTIASALPPGTRRRALLLEAAGALVEGERPAQAGRIYEHLGLLRQAAEAYTAGGEIERLEAIHERLEARDDAQRAQRALEDEIAAVLEAGRRRLAHSMLLEQRALAEREGEVLPGGLAQTLAELERRMIRGRALSLRVRSSEDETVVRVVGRPALRFGRGPQCELSVSGPALSREHAELAQATAPEGEPTLVARDLGSRAGTFVDGLPLAPGEDWPLLDEAALTGADDPPVELALGIAASFDLAVRVLEADPRPVALVREASVDAPPTTLNTAWTLFLPVGGPLWPSPEAPLPLRLRFDGDHLELLPDPQVRLSLDGVPAGVGTAIEVLVRDRVELTTPGGERLELEIEELRL
ncbi:hypothetical protein PPSIR1_09660 [Plesiocystis pacifica SIR-1]|uniref:FHA domain-containing protein n=1 Tax=Plesiocystis pacifica SIR-1 TaxID=391625 RepID=A6G9D8_9BACT|nr:FHA domain-containing protein [Plesiocystis pacifica]EDM77560.1 hypothetical protein PPSIR1_09660 [Plesiocystis pacifica SIR-1]